MQRNENKILVAARITATKHSLRLTTANRGGPGVRTDRAIPAYGTLGAGNVPGAVRGIVAGTGGYAGEDDEDNRTDPSAHTRTESAGCAGNFRGHLTGAVIWSVGSAGGQPKKILDNADAAAISPHGKMLIAYRKGHALWSAGPDGRNAARSMEFAPRETGRFRSPWPAQPPLWAPLRRRCPAWRPSVALDSAPNAAGANLGALEGSDWLYAPQAVPNSRRALMWPFGGQLRQSLGTLARRRRCFRA